MGGPECVVVSSLSHASNKSVVASNLALFPDTWERICLAHERVTPPSGCGRLVVHPGFMWSSVLNASRGFTRRCSTVALLLDDVRLDTDPLLVLDAMRTHSLDVATPRVLYASHAFMKAPFPPAGVGEEKGCVIEARMVEFFATFFTGRAWACAMSLFAADALGTDTLGIGWGYDVCLGAACPGQRMGVVLDAQATHLKSGEGWTFPSQGRRLTLRGIDERHSQARLVREWAERTTGRRCIRGTWAHSRRDIRCATDGAFVAHSGSRGGGSRKNREGWENEEPPLP